MKKHLLNIVDIREELSDMKTFFLQCPEDYDWAEGSVTHIAHPGYENEEGWVRHMSIMTLPQEGLIGFTTRIHDNSIYKQKLNNLKIGDTLVVFKTHSHLTLRRENRPIVFISMGVALATLRPLFLTLKKDNHNIKESHHLHVYKESDLLYGNETSDCGINQHLVKNRQAFSAVLPDLLRDDALYYVVGSDDFMRDTIVTLKSLNVKSDQIVIDRRPTLRFMYKLEDGLFA